MDSEVNTHGAKAVRGFYSRETVTDVYKNFFGKEVDRKESVSEQIHILSHQRPDNFMATAIHELTHDLIADHYPRLKDAPDWVHEGICQYVAATYCRKFQFGDALHVIETSPNPVYGDGYRYFKKTLGDNNWAGLKNWMLNSPVPSR